VNGVIVDDIIDQSEERNNRKSWYKTTNVGLSAVYDAILLMSLGFDMFKRHSSNSQFYYDLLKSVHAEAFCLHMAELADKRHKPDTFSFNLYETIIKIKNSNSILILVFVAMKLAGIADKKVFEITKDIVMKLGRLTQAEVFHDKIFLTVFT